MIYYGFGICLSPLMNLLPVKIISAASDTFGVMEPSLLRKALAQRVLPLRKLLPGLLPSIPRAPPSGEERADM